MAARPESESRAPRVVVLAGPNGAGKSTTASAILQGVLGVTEFVNADQIAAGLSGFAPKGVAYEAGRIMLERIRALADARRDFAFETTLASRSFAPWLRDLVQGGYEFHLVFLWLPSPESAIARVEERVRRGGHDVDVETVRRRYFAGLRNFFSLYAPLATSWRMIDNRSRVPTLLAAGARLQVELICNSNIWTSIQKSDTR